MAIVESANEERSDPGDLSPRQREILKIVVQTYTSGALPIGSRTIQLEGQLDVSTATIRNELAALEELGYLVQPYTSAGRVPSIRGYRYFVEQLMDQVDLSLPEQRMIRHQFHQLQLNLDQWMRLTAAVLAHSTQAASVVTSPHGKQTRFKHLELIVINESVILLIVVFQDSSIHQEMLMPPNSIGQEMLSQISNKLNSLLGNHTVTEIRSLIQSEQSGITGWELSVLQRVLQVMENSEESWTSTLYSDGLENVLLEPEFEEAGKFRQVVRVLQERNLLETILARMIDASGVQIIIGGEGRYEYIDDVSLVLSPYGVRGQSSGVLGVIGPTRMLYARAISTVRYMAQLMDNLLTEVYGGE
jgi:heat-inducible transcriptional repressor